MHSYVLYVALALTPSAINGCQVYRMEYFLRFLLIHTYVCTIDLVFLLSKYFCFYQKMKIYCIKFKLCIKYFRFRVKNENILLEDFLIGIILT